MTKPVRYQDGCLYADNGAWFVKYRVQVRQEDGSIQVKQRSKMLGRLVDYPRESDIMPLKIELMQRINAGKFSPHSSMNLRDSVEKVYLPYIEELRASTKRGIGKSGTITSATASDTFDCVSSEPSMPARCCGQSRRTMT